MYAQVRAQVGSDLTQNQEAAARRDHLPPRPTPPSPEASLSLLAPPQASRASSCCQRSRQRQREQHENSKASECSFELHPGSLLPAAADQTSVTSEQGCGLPSLRYVRMPCCLSEAGGRLGTGVRAAPGQQLAGWHPRCHCGDGESCASREAPPAIPTHPSPVLSCRGLLIGSWKKREGCPSWRPWSGRPGCAEGALSEGCRGELQAEGKWRGHMDWGAGACGKERGFVYSCSRRLWTTVGGTLG